MNLFDLIDLAVNKWISWRTDREIKRSGLWQELGIKSIDVDDEATNLVLSHPVIAIVADEAAQLLHDCNAPNYVQFDMLPRVDRHLDPIRVTVQWAHGLSPSEEVKQLQEELDLLKECHDDHYQSYLAVCKKNGELRDILSHLYYETALKMIILAGKNAPNPDPASVLEYISTQSSGLYHAMKEAHAALEVDDGRRD
jgi:hypothetical protein